MLCKVLILTLELLQSNQNLRKEIFLAILTQKPCLSKKIGKKWNTIWQTSIKFLQKSIKPNRKIEAANSILDNHLSIQPISPIQAWKRSNHQSNFLIKSNRTHFFHFYFFPFLWFSTTEIKKKSRPFSFFQSDVTCSNNFDRLLSKM